jgi:hypothetical protein
VSDPAVTNGDPNKSNQMLSYLENSPDHIGLDVDDIQNDKQYTEFIHFQSFKL